MTASPMRVKARSQWTEADLLSVAGLIVSGETNGGQDAPVSAEDVAAQLPDSPAVAVFDGARAVFVAGLWPYDARIPRGLLHIAGTGEYREGEELMRRFLAALPDVDVLAYTDKPALARLAGRVGLKVTGEQGGYLILGRVT